MTTALTSPASVLLLLLLAHLVGDFILQSKQRIEERYKYRLQSSWLYLHALVHLMLSLLVLTLVLDKPLAMLGYASIIGLSHLVIDIGKSYLNPERPLWFLLDQALHILVILAVWLALNHRFGDISELLQPQLENAELLPILVIVLAYVVCIWPASKMIGLICKQWSAHVTDQGSLPNAGATIGQLERFLILTFILVGQFAAIGFLLAAKSVLRLGDTKENEHRKINEYILLGTLLSFAITITIGLVLTRVLMVLS